MVKALQFSGNCLAKRQDTLDVGVDGLIVVDRPLGCRLEHLGGRLVTHTLRQIDPADPLDPRRVLPDGGLLLPQYTFGEKS